VTATGVQLRVPTARGAPGPQRRARPPSRPGAHAVGAPKRKARAAAAGATTVAFWQAPRSAAAGACTGPRRRRPAPR